jgi:hypothetical protein
MLAGLLLCEILLRLFGNYLIPPRREAVYIGRAVTEYVKHVPLAPGVDRAWFSDDVPPLPNRSQVDPNAAIAMDGYVKRGLYGPQSFYVWNRRFVEDNMCRSGRGFDNYPPDILVFDPPSGTPFPRFRFPGSKTLPSGLVTNSFGFRGPEISLRKPRDTIRIAFVGASTTVDVHSYQHSYPELVGYWMNRYLTAHNLNVKVEIINAGREGIIPNDTEAIVREEILPLEPDLVVYYEGANEFSASANLSVHLTGLIFRPKGVPNIHPIGPFFTKYSALAKLVDTVVADRTTELREPPKPGYTFQWKGVKEFSPDLTRTDLPLKLSTVLGALDHMRLDVANEGGQLVLSSFIWLVWDGMMLSPVRHQYIYKHLNGDLWPLTYADIRRLADFQNRVFQTYASQHGVPFLDVADEVPKDPDLFTDAIHMTESGCRLRAWVVLQGLIPVLQRELDSKRLPRPARLNLERHPALGPTAPMHIDCTSQAK